MPQLIRVADVEDIPVSQGKEVLVGDRIVAVFNVDGQFHALDGVCPHAGGPLGEGTLTGSIVTCPWHGWQFDVTTGMHCLNKRIAHPTYRVEVQGRDVFVEMP